MEPIKFGEGFQFTASAEVDGDIVKIIIDGLEIDERLWMMDENGGWEHVSSGSFTCDTSELPDRIVTMQVFTWENNDSSQQVDPNDDSWDLSAESLGLIELRIINSEGDVTIQQN